MLEHEREREERKDGIKGKENMEEAKNKGGTQAGNEKRKG